MTVLDGVDAALLVYRLVIWLLDLDDGSGSKDWRRSSLSITKLAGAAAVVVGLRAAWLAGKDVHGAIIFLLVTGISALFGRSMWKCYLLRNEFKTTVSGSYERSEKVTRADDEKRYTIEGIPKYSNPPVTGATTPAGDD